MADDYGEKEESSITHSNIKKKPKNPVAVSIDDAKKKGDLPTISAAGRGKIAEQILQLAFENDIKVREDSALAVLANIELDSPIPSEAFMAVAEIMSYVYKANGAENPFDTVLEKFCGPMKIICPRPPKIKIQKPAAPKRHRYAKNGPSGRHANRGVKDGRYRTGSNIAICIFAHSGAVPDGDSGAYPEENKRRIITRKTKERQLSIIETLHISPKTKLFLVACDHKNYLVCSGPHGETVVDPSIYPPHYSHRATTN